MVFFLIWKELVTSIGELPLCGEGGNRRNLHFVINLSFFPLKYKFRNVPSVPLTKSQWS